MSLRLLPLLICAALAAGARLALAAPAATDSMQTMLAAPKEHCTAAPVLPVKRCEPGAGFLCVNTPPGGVDGDTVTITGLVDRAGNTFAGMIAQAQHEQTKATVMLDTGAAPGGDGAFALTVSLSQVGSYVVTIQALRANGAPAVETVRVSRVTAPVMDAAVVTITPDPAATDGVIDADSVELHIDLLPHCERCDTIGSHTGATMLTVRNTITLEDGATRAVERKTNLGADGVFALCLPVSPGRNHVEVVACNAATGDDPQSCPRAAPVEFQVRDTESRIEILSPQGEAPFILDAATFPTVPLRFRVAGIDARTACVASLVAASPDACQAKSASAGPVAVEWNHETHAPCPDADGVFTLALRPHTGMNLAVIRATTPSGPVERALTVGWGTLRSPWRADGTVNEDMLWLPDAFTLGLRQQFIGDTVRELVNHMVISDTFREMLRDMTDQPPGAATSAGDSEVESVMEQIRAEIPACAGGNGGAVGRMRIQLVEPPHIGDFEIQRIDFAKDEMPLRVVVRDLLAKLRLHRVDADGTDTILPLKISLQKLVMEPHLRLLRSADTGGKPLLVLSAETTDCDYKNRLYCRNQPALLIPKNIYGNATSSGGFVVCDHRDQVVAPDVARACRALNLLNAQTGLLQQEVLDAVNDLLSCQLSATLTYTLREGVQEMPLVLPGALGARFPPLPIGVDLLGGMAEVSARGIASRLATRIGSAEYFRALPASVRTPSVGYLVAPVLQRPADRGLAGVADIALGVNADFVNQALFALAIRGDALLGEGILDWDLDETTFRTALGFDFVQQCDAFVPVPGVQDTPSPLCASLRPQVSVLLGSALTTGGYFPPKQPLRLRLRGSRRVVPHVRFFTATVPQGTTETDCLQATRQAQFVELQMPDVEISFYALAIDQAAGLDAYGNPVPQTDAGGQTVIQSMRPELPDPYDGPILRAHMTALIVLEIGALHPDPKDPSRLMTTLTTSPTFSRIAFEVRPSDNATLVPDDSLVAALRDKLLIGVDWYSNPANALSISIPKRFHFGSDAGETLWARLITLSGMREIRLASDAVDLQVDRGQQFLTIGASLSMTQQLQVDGAQREWNIPR